jgi:hypothetical protein
MAVGVAHATRHVSPWSGRGANGPFGLVCMNVDFTRGEIVNGCDSEQSFMVPLMFDNSGSKNVSFWIVAASLNDGCSAVTIHRTGGGFVATAPRRPTELGTDTKLTTSSVTVNGDNQFLADCTLEVDSRLGTFTFAQ